MPTVSASRRLRWFAAPQEVTNIIASCGKRSPPSIPSRSSVTLWVEGVLYLRNMFGSKPGSKRTTERT